MVLNKYILDFYVFNSPGHCSKRCVASRTHPRRPRNSRRAGGDIIRGVDRAIVLPTAIMELGAPPDAMVMVFAIVGGR
jgi:hypothetical protein